MGSLRSKAKQAISRLGKRHRRSRPQGAEPLPDYREFVGGYWDLMGRLQVSYLIHQGLRRHHRLLDLGCGSLRAGRFLILYLDQGHYYGLDRNAFLIEKGKSEELSSIIVAEQQPHFIVTDRFDVSSISPVPADYVWAQSLFTHLTLADIELCLTQMKKVVGRESRFFVTFSENAAKEPDNPSESGALKDFWYGFDTLQQVARRCGFAMHHLGDFRAGELQHPFTDHPTTPTKMTELTLL